MKKFFNIIIHCALLCAVSTSFYANASEKQRRVQFSQELCDNAGEESYLNIDSLSENLKVPLLGRRPKSILTERSMEAFQPLSPLSPVKNEEIKDLSPIFEEGRKELLETVNKMLESREMPLPAIYSILKRLQSHASHEFTPETLKENLSKRIFEEDFHAPEEEYVGSSDSPAKIELKPTFKLPHVQQYMNSKGDRKLLFNDWSQLFRTSGGKHNAVMPGFFIKMHSLIAELSSITKNYENDTSKIGEEQNTLSLSEDKLTKGYAAMRSATDVSDFKKSTRSFFSNTAHTLNALSPIIARSAELVRQHNKRQNDPVQQSAKSRINSFRATKKDSAKEAGPQKNTTQRPPSPPKNSAHRRSKSDTEPSKSALEAYEKVEGAVRSVF